MLVSTAEKQFVNDAVKSSTRVDGRRLDEIRETKFHPLQTSGSIEVSIGMTRALAYVEVEHTLPHPDRPSEGIVNFQVEYSPSANQDRAFEFLMGSASEDPLLTREVERAIRDSRALDTEALCILASKLVWSLKVVITILDHCGNVSDVAQVAAIAALKHARRPDFTISGKEVTIHPVTHREAVPLPINFMPIMTTFALFDSGAVVVIDPSALEEAAMEGKVAVVMNEHKEICGIRKPGGVCIELELLVQMVKMAGARTLKLAKELTRSLKSGPTEMLHDSSPTLPDPNLMFNSLGAQQAENCVVEIGAEMKSPGNARDEPPRAPTETLTDTDNHSNAPHPPPSADTVQRNDIEMAHEDESETANAGKGFKTSQDSKNLESSDSDDDDIDGDLMAALISRPRGGGGSGRRRPKQQPEMDDARRSLP